VVRLTMWRGHLAAAVRVRVDRRLRAGLVYVCSRRTDRGEEAAGEEERREGQAKNERR